METMLDLFTLSESTQEDLKETEELGTDGKKVKIAGFL
jgi:hypothetical protein